MAQDGWDLLLKDANWARGPGHYPITAYSEYMPPPWLGIKAYDCRPRFVRDPQDNFGWNISEWEQYHQLESGLKIVAREILKEITALGQGRSAPQIGKAHLRNNPYWPEALAARAGHLAHERYLILAAVALSRTQDDKGRVRWTLFGASDLGPAASFWKGFWFDPKKERPAEEGRAFFREILQAVYGETHGLDDLAHAGLRILPCAGRDNLYEQVPEAIPSWCQPLLWNPRGSLRGVRFLLTFRPFARLPEKVQRAYLSGKLHLLPFPGSLVFWGSPLYRNLSKELPRAGQTSLLHLFPRYNAPYGVRIPQAGWVDFDEEAKPNHEHAPRRTHYVRTHRWQRFTREQEETEHLEGGDQVSHVLFSTEPKDLGLYDKPMARNAQLWTGEYKRLLDGPRAGRKDLYTAAKQIEQGGRFGYRFLFPPMRVGPWEIYWHRTVAAFPGPAPEKPFVLGNAPLGYLTATRFSEPDSAPAVELWPRLLRRTIATEAAELFLDQKTPRLYSETLNVRHLLEVWEYFGRKPLPRSFARSLILAPKAKTIDEWLTNLPKHASDAKRAEGLAQEIRNLVADQATDQADDSVTYGSTATREFEVTYWNTIAALAHGDYRNKANSDCFQDEPTQEALTRLSRGHKRDLDPLGDYLIRRHQQAIVEAGMEKAAWAGEHAFRWETDFEFPRWDAWVKNQNGSLHERNVMVRIPGKDSSKAVIMSDHYDTAYMEDQFEKRAGGIGGRLSACGADDNHSATAALLLAAPLFLRLSKEGKLACDIWLVHLTGEEFPSDCMGARHLCQDLVQGTLQGKALDGTTHDLGGVTCRGVYVADMIAHNNPHDHNVFQIAPGEGKDSAWLAYQAHQANRLWNERAKKANLDSPRKDAPAARRSIDPRKAPDLAPHATLSGEIRPSWGPRSTLYNTDGIIFSDAGVPVVLFMENYDINRQGYHDSHDTMENIDLDYGAALAAIFIESVARAACAEST